MLGPEQPCLIPKLLYHVDQNWLMKQYKMFQYKILNCSFYKLDSVDQILTSEYLGEWRLRRTMSANGRARVLLKYVNIKSQKQNTL